MSGPGNEHVTNVRDTLGHSRSQIKLAGVVVETGRSSGVPRGKRRGLGGGVPRANSGVFKSRGISPRSATCDVTGNQVGDDGGIPDQSGRRSRAHELGGCSSVAHLAGRTDPVWTELTSGFHRPIFGVSEARLPLVPTGVLPQVLSPIPACRSGVDAPPSLRIRAVKWPDVVTEPYAGGGPKPAEIGCGRPL